MLSLKLCGGIDGSTFGEKCTKKTLKLFSPEGSEKWNEPCFPHLKYRVMLCHNAVCWRAPANITPTEQRKLFLRNINEERQKQKDWFLGNMLH